jgi:guanine deaminase
VIENGSGASVQHNPWSNLRLGSGVAPVRALLDAGVNVSVAIDGCSSTDTCNVLNSTGLAAALHGIRGEVSSRVSAREAFRAATVGGANALGRQDELGIIEEGAVADLVLYSLGSIPFVPEGDLIQQIVYAERDASIQASFVEGHPIFASGRFTGIDETSILAEVNSEFERLQPLYEEAEKSAARMIPALSRIQARCARHPINDQTFQARLA